MTEKRIWCEKNKNGGEQTKNGAKKLKLKMPRELNKMVPKSQNHIQIGAKPTKLLKEKLNLVPEYPKLVPKNPHPFHYFMETRLSIFDLLF